jgi:hypothetical protein
MPSQKKYANIKISVSVRIGPGFNQVSGNVSGSGSRRAKITHNNRKIRKISWFKVLDVIF